MRVVRKITPEQIRRVKYMMLFVAVQTGVQYLVDGLVAEAKIKDQNFSGPYIWAGTVYEKTSRTYMPGGMIEEYTNKETFCTSWIYHVGLSLVSEGALGVLHLLFLAWLFIGISILADIFMDAIEVITSKSTFVMIPD